jgi:hypothetical protein
MRKYFWLVPVAMLAFGGVANAQDKPKAEKKAKAAAKLVADPEKIDLGDLKASETKDVVFKLKNDGDAEAKNVACKAAGIKFEKAKVTIAAGASEEMKGTYAAPKKVGKKDKITQVKLTCGKVIIPITLTLRAAEAPAKDAPAKDAPAKK